MGGQEVPATDDLLAMLQNSLRVSQSSQDVQPQQIADGGLPDMKSISSLEQLVLARANEGKLSGDNKLAATINASIKTFMTGIIATTAANQKTIKDDIKAFSKCKLSMWKEYGKALKTEKKFWMISKVYPKCIAAEKKLKLQKDVNDKKMKSYQSQLKVLKRRARVEEKKCVNVCTNNYNEKLQRLVKYYKDCKKKIGPRVMEINKLNKKWKPVAEKRRISDAKYQAMKNKCKRIAYLMNQNKCKVVSTLSTSCSFYEACWKRAKKTYDKDRAYIEVQEKEMKIEWRALTRIQCYLKVLNIKNDKNQ